MTISPDIQALFREYFEALSEYDAFDYQRHDAALAAVAKTAMFTHTMGLGKTRIALLATEIIRKSTLIMALPRLVRIVWAAEMRKLGISDYIILERPRQNRMEFIAKRKGQPDKYRGLKGIGKIRPKSVSRDSDCTADPAHPSRYKIMSYNMILPQTVSYDYVKCSCGHIHNQEKCPNVSVSRYRSHERRHMTTEEIKWVESRREDYMKGKISSFKQLCVVIHEKYPDVDPALCNRPLKGANCPHCGNTLGNVTTSGKTGKYIKADGYYCRHCDYSARTWIPSMARRLKKHVRVAIMDESQAVKNWNSLRTKYALSIKPPYRFLTSGTPATTEVARDLYYQLRWLINSKVFFPFVSFNSFGRFIADQAATMEGLHKLLDPFQIRREVDDYGVSRDVKLPPVIERRFTIPMSDEEIANYQAAEADMASWFASVNHEEISDLDLFSKMWVLRRAACIPWVDNKKIIVSTTIEALKVEVANLVRQNRKVLIGSEMLEMLDAVEEAIPNAVRIDGDVPIKTADDRIALFQETCPKCKISLVDEFGEKVCPLCEKTYETPMVIITSRKAVREGVTLNKASCVIATDPSWTYADMWQWWKRAHRVGASYDHLDVIYMESADTIETRMYDEAERRKVAIIMAINRKNVEKSEKIDIRNFVSELLGHTQYGPIDRDLAA